MLEKIKYLCKSTSLRYEFYDHTNHIPVKDWNLVNSKGNLFLTIDYLKTLESTLTRTMDFRYILFYKEKIPVAIAATQLVTFNADELEFQQFPCKIGDAIGNKILKNLDAKVLVCGNLFSCGEHGFMYTDLLNSKDAFESLSDALREIRKSGSSDKPSFILLKEFWPESFDSSDTIKKQKFREFKIDVNMVLEIHPLWNTIEDYLASMKTKFRTRAKAVFKKSKTLEVKNFNPKEIEFYKTKINSLYHSVIENADFKVEKLNSNTFKSLKQSLGDAFIFKAYFIDQELVGFTTAFILDNAVDANHIGIDYTYNKSHAIYQKMLYDYVELAISKKTKHLRLGRTAEIIKSSVGAKPVEMKLYVRHGNSFSNKLLKPMVELISPSEYEIRNPFKLQLD